MECWAIIHPLTFGRTTAAELSAVHPYRTLPLVLISVRGWVHPRGTECGQKEEVTWKLSKDPTGNRT